jgi:hypothetical protein
MQILISDDRGPLNRVKCPRPFFPPISLDVCKKCRWHVSLQIPVTDQGAYICCHLEGEWYNAELVP